MRLPLTVLSAMVLVGCDGYHAPPTYPDPPAPASVPPPPTSPGPVGAASALHAMAFDEASHCIGDTAIELVSAQTVRDSKRHDANCDPWEGGGVSFFDVTPGEEVVLRASAAGYATQQRTIVVLPDRQQWVLFTLRRSQ